MTTSNSSINQNDFDSPGYEYLRSYQNMSNLYYKLVALNYQTEFCSKYKCPLIHKYYFSVPSKSKSEQQFLFSCLCAWLIKDKCQMNLELEPEEYEDQDTSSEIIIEALDLLLTSEDEIINRKRESKKSAPLFPVSRLKQGFGPEVVWTLSILADRALELMFDQAPSTTNKESRIIHNNKTNYNSNSSLSSVADRIVIGGSADDSTFRLPDNYRVDDPDLLFDDGLDQSEV